MSQKRNRSVNWDEEEKQLFCSVLKDYTNILEDKSLKTNTNKSKAKAWEDVHKKFNELNCRTRELCQLQIQWKKMKMSARKAHSSFNTESRKTGGGSRPSTPDNLLIEVKDLLNPAELLKDHNIYDSDWCPVTTDSNCNVKVMSERKNVAGPSQDSVIELNSFDHAYSQIDNPDVIVINTEPDIEIYNESEPITHTSMDNITNNSITETPTMNSLKRKISPKQISQRSKAWFKHQKNSRTAKDDDYKWDILNHSKHLKDVEHQLRMKMEKELHDIRIKIKQEKLQSSTLERQIFEIKLEYEKEKLQMLKQGKINKL